VGASNEQGDLAEIVHAVDERASRWVGIDKDESLIEKYPEKKLVCLDLNDDFDLSIKGVELVIMTEVLEHLESPVRTLRRLSAGFKGVEFLGSVPNGLSIGKIIMGFFMPRRYGSEDGGHFMVFNRNTIKCTFRAAGVELQDIIPYERHACLRPLVRLYPHLASGFIIRAVL
jgi:hypothetical protein